MFYDFWLAGQQLWNLPLLMGLICSGLFYGCMMISFTKVKLYHKQPLLFFLSLAILYVTIGSPLATLSHLAVSLHMIQMSILFFIFPPLFILGIPASFPKKMGGIKKLFFPPKVALVVFASLFLMYHTSIVLAFLSQHSFLHNSYLVVLLLLSFSMWRPIALGQNKRYAYWSGLLLLPACSLFIINACIGGANNPLLTEMMATFCMNPSQLSTLTILPAPFNTRIDQIMAGILMLGMHKFSIHLTVRLGRKGIIREWGRNG
ncbi:cytochrome c oxidase assembly protein [Neobacillus jeddahensis]|uniref:cytochrome c oxidase assembly protein n=1 Tax=Neobacillus jeddahensis TaxID=1461580 RepID=UPI00058F1DA0|nr:cytochrome c oxidase assembly protein [Neobacillus jeddahensis]